MFLPPLVRKPSNGLIAHQLRVFQHPMAHGRQNSSSMPRPGFQGGGLVTDPLFNPPSPKLRWLKQKMSIMIKHDQSMFEEKSLRMKGENNMKKKTS